MRLLEIIESLRDGKRYAFTHENLLGYFHKAPFPDQEVYTERDGALSAVTYLSKTDHKPISPVMLLDDFDREDWTLEELPTE